MKTVHQLLFSFWLLLPSAAWCAPFPMLFVNEISQGVQGSQEYVELAIMTSCNTGGINTLDIRRMIIDDNDGRYQSGPTANISTGALRFADISFWQAIPEGTIIVIYNEANRNPAIPPDDFSINDGNSRLILPANSVLLEGQGISPTPASSTYTGPWIAGGGLWSYVSMEDSGDTFKVQATWSSYLVANDISWGTNTGTLQTPSQYFTGSAAGLVYYVDTHLAQGGWTAAPAATAQTPGEVNSPANYNLIYQAADAPPMQALLVTTPETCFNTCNASIFVDATGGTVPYTYIWDNLPSQSSQMLQNVCPGTYSVTVKDMNGCSVPLTVNIAAAAQIIASISVQDESCLSACDGSIALEISGGTGPVSVNWTDGSMGFPLNGLCADIYQATLQDSLGCTVEVQAIVHPGPQAVNSVFASAGPFQENDPPVQLQNSIPGGTYTTGDCTGCLTPGGMFDPSASGQGIFNICYTLPEGCSSVQCNQITVGPCTPRQTAETLYICEGDSIQVFGNWETQQDIFSQSFEGVSCDSIHRVTLLYYPAPDVYTTLSLCEGDSAEVFGVWVDSSGVFGQEMLSLKGCRYMKYITVTESFCADEALIYIPNAFTPDGDQVNDVFRIEILGAIVGEGYIYDRWGETIASFDEHHLTWDGNNRQGRPVPDGVYVYYVKYFTIQGTNEERIGHVTLLR